MIRSEKIHLHTTSTNEMDTIHICSDLFMKWNLSSDNKYNFQCGAFNHDVTIYPDIDLLPNSVCVHPNFLIECRLPTFIRNLTFHFHQKSNIIAIGIFVGLITDVKETEEGASFGSIQQYSKELATYCTQNHILLYVFSLKNFDPILSKLKGYIWNNNGWEQYEVPTPHVIHNRIHSRKREQSTSYEQLIKILKEKHIPFFNDHFLNKWETHQSLNEQVHLLPFLPETKLLLNLQTLESFLQKHEKVFIKPAHGSQGRKIIRIERTNAEYILDYTTFSGEIERNFPTLRQLFKVIRPRLSKQAYIVQQGIELIRYQDRILDFRFLCHLNSLNQWQVTSSVARIAAPYQFVSNIARDGELWKVNTVLKEILDYKSAVTINKMLHELAIEIALSINQSEDGLYGELGIDLAIDTAGKPWIIEVNTKPSKNPDYLSHSPSVRPSAKAIINYCLFLANPFQRSDLK